MKKQLLIWILLLSCSLTAFAQADKVEITGVVIDELNEPMIGVNIMIKDSPGMGTVTDLNGKFRVKAALYQTLIFSYIGYDKQEIPIKNSGQIKVNMKVSQSSVLDEVTITGTGVQKKATVTGAITTVNVKALQGAGGAATSITNALAGNVAGIIGMQTSGEPGKISEFWIRGISTFGANSQAMVLVDGFERSMNELNIEDIESFSVLKDASATAIYGSRGANGVVLITTKKGQTGKVNIEVKAEASYNTRTRTPEYVDGNTYAQLLNEAKITRNLEPEYTPNELEILRLQLDPDLYPNVDWKDVLLKDGAMTERATLNISGGGSTARYYISGSYLNQEGMYKTDQNLKKDYNTNANLSRWNYRMNVDVDVTKTTLLSVGLSGTLQKQNRPGQGNDVWSAIIGQTPIAIPQMYSNGLIPAWGSNERSNPWVIATQTGYQENWSNVIQTNITLNQKFDFITKGLYFVGRFGFDSNSENENKRTKRPEQYIAEDRRDPAGNLVMKRVVDEQLMQQSAWAKGNRVENLEAELHYDRAFAQMHQVGLTLKYSQRQQIETVDVGNDVIKGIALRNQGVSGRLTYAYGSRYFAEFNFGYTGSENFSSGNQFGFFPAVSGGWNIAEEKFIKDHWKWMDMLKLRYSYGEVGNDKVSGGTRFPYLSSFGGMDGWNFGGVTNPWGVGGYHYSQVASPNLSWEIAKKHNLGLDLSLFNGDFSLTVDVYQDTREKIYMQRKYLPQIVGVSSQPWANVGKMQSTGMDGNIMFHRQIGKVDLTARANMTYTKNEVLEYDEEANAYAYQKTEGYRWGQTRGLISLGLFKDYDDIRNSPQQHFGDYMPGDIKYQDVNGDGVVNGNDVVPIGATKTPNLIYGVGLSARWNNFDINVHFQGAGKSNYMIGGPVHAFWGGKWGNVSTDMAIPGNRWISREISGTADTENPNAKYPRLSYGGNGNNFQGSTHWMRDGSYLRFKTLELGYSFPQNIVRLMRMSDLRLFFLGNNLAVWDSLKLWDPEQASDNGNAYPLSKTFTLGLTVKF